MLQQNMRAYMQMLSMVQPEFLQPVIMRGLTTANGFIGALCKQSGSPSKELTT